VEAINFIPINGALSQEAERPEISGTWFEQKKPSISLPLSRDHKKVINGVWNYSKLDNLPEAKGSEKARYKIIDEDFKKYLKPTQIDSLHKHELGNILFVTCSGG
jgi:hypothetical protein